MRLSLRRISSAFGFVLAAVSAAAQSVDHAKQLFDAAKYADARSELLTLLKTNDRNAAATHLLGRIASAQNDADEAVRLQERAVELESGNALYHLWLGNALSDQLQHANMLRQPFIARRVKTEWERAVELDPNSIDARMALLQLYVSAPAAMGGSVEKAEEQATEIGKRNPMRGAMARAKIAEIGKDAGAEEAAYKQAIAAAPDSSAGVFAFVNMYARVGKATEAFATLDAYAKRRKDDKWIPYYTGRIAGVTGQKLDPGVTALQHFISTPPADARPANIANAHYWLGQIAEKKGDTNGARGHYEAALKLNPNSTLSQKALAALK